MSSTPSPREPEAGAAAPLTVLVNATASRTGGGLTFVTNELSALARRRDIVGHVLASPWNVDALTDAVPWPVHDIGARRVTGRYAFEQTGLRRWARDFDVLYSPNNLGPLLRPGVPNVLAIQDANYFQPPEWRTEHLTRGKQARRALCVRSARIADEVVLISQALRSLVAASLPDVAERATVVNSGAAAWPDAGSRPPGFSPDAGTYLVSVAHDYGHKRLDDLVDAWQHAFSSHTGTPSASGRAPSLVLCGSVGPERAALLRGRAGDLADHLVLLGTVEDRGELRWLVENAVASVSVSVLEAHPLTPAEAGALGCPLVLSDIPAHREIAGDHATYVPPGDRDALAGVLRSTWEDPPPRRPWLWHVTWDHHAAELAGVLRRAAGVSDRIPARGPVPT